MISLSRREEQVLLAVWNLKNDAYLNSIKKHLESLTNAEWPLSAVQKPLLQLERKGYIRTKMGEPTAIRGGRRKKMCEITRQGIAALKNLKAEQDKLWKEFLDLELKSSN